MRIGRVRMVLLATLVAVAGVLPGAEVAGAGSAPAGAAGGAGAGSVPAGFAITCKAKPLADGLVQQHHRIDAYGSGKCTLTGSLGAPWILDIAVRIQQKVGGAWRTRADGFTQTDQGGAAKSVDYFVVSLDCSGPTRFQRGPWRFRVVVRAYVSEKAATVLKRVVADSGTTTFAC